jgi:glycosyltransferase involved in cell wall biosynthesis
VQLYDDLRWAWKFFRARNNYDVLLTGSERPALILALMQRILPPEARVPHVLLECMWNIPDSGLGRWKRRLLLRWVAEAVDRIVVYARHQSDAYARLLGVSKQKFAFIHSHSTLYGVNYSPTSGDYIFSGGYTNRDYPTLFAAVRNLPYRIVVCIGSRSGLGAEIPSNVEIQESVPEDTFNRLMAASAFVVIPLRGGVLEPGGRQVFQNAMAMGKAVIVTDLFATDYIIDGINGILVAPESPVQLRAWIIRLMSDLSLKQALERAADRSSEEFTPEHFFERLFTVVEDVRTDAGLERSETQVKAGSGAI